jgi:hypothetical protein
LTDCVNATGALGTPHGASPTVTTTSFDGPLAPTSFRARTRTKYVPSGTFETVSSGATTGKLAMAGPALTSAASIWKLDGAGPEPADQVIVTVLPETSASKPKGAPGTL